MKKMLRFAIIGLMATLFASSSYAQEWTKAQLEVWKTVENEWKSWKAGDVDGLAAIMHEKYQGWNAEDPLPVNKTTVVGYYTTMKDLFKVQSMNINPARITVTENTAVVDYYFMFTYTMGEGEKQKSEEYKGRSIECYTREGGKWLLLGDLMVFDEDDEEDDD